MFNTSLQLYNTTIKKHSHFLAINKISFFMKLRLKVQHHI